MGTQELEIIEVPEGTLVHVEGMPFVVGRGGVSLLGRPASWELAMQLRKDNTPVVGGGTELQSGVPQ